MMRNIDRGQMQPSKDIRWQSSIYNVHTSLLGCVRGRCAAFAKLLDPGATAWIVQRDLRCVQLTAPFNSPRYSKPGPGSPMCEDTILVPGRRWRIAAARSFIVSSLNITESINTRSASEKSTSKKLACTKLTPLPDPEIPVSGAR